MSISGVVASKLNSTLQECDPKLFAAAAEAKSHAVLGRLAEPSAHFHSAIDARFASVDLPQPTTIKLSQSESISCQRLWYQR